MRFMDSRDDEQARGITMKSSSITLIYNDPVEYRKKKRELLNNDISIKDKFKSEKAFDDLSSHKPSHI